MLEGIQTLNEWALEGRLEVTAISLHTYPFVQDRYVILPHGASMGSGYGPVIVAKRPLSKGDLADIEIAVPGRMTRLSWRLASTWAATSASARWLSTRSWTRSSRAGPKPAFSSTRAS